MEEPTESKEIGEDDVELLADSIEYQKKLNFDVIIFRHIDRCNKVLSMGEPLAYGNCIAGFYAMLAWYFDKPCIEKLNKLDEKFNDDLNTVVGNKTKIDDAEKAEYNRLQFQYIIDKFSILVDLLGRRGKLWMNT